MFKFLARVIVIVAWVLIIYTFIADTVRKTKHKGKNE